MLSRFLNFESSGQFHLFLAYAEKFDECKISALCCRFCIFKQRLDPKIIFEGAKGETLHSKGLTGRLYSNHRWYLSDLQVSSLC